MNEYEAKLEARRERYLERAARADREARARMKAANDAVAGIPLGQPILIGHHSERRHRGALARQDRNMRAAIEAEKKAQYYRGKAAGIGQSGISSDDPEAVDKLRERVAELEKLQARMKAANRIVRAFYKAGCRHDSPAGELTGYLAKMDGQGIGPRAARALLEGDSCGRRGFPDYRLQNNNANIRRLKQRIAQLENAATREPQEKALPGGIRYAEADNRVRIIFPDKPSAEIRTILKRHGFRWAPSAGAWQRHLNNAGIFNAQAVLERIGALHAC